MKQRIYQLAMNPLISGSAVVILGSFISNFLNFIYNFFMVRNLSVAEYGVLASLVSLVMMVSTPAGAIFPTLVKFAAEYFANNEIGKVKGLYFRVVKVMLILGVVIFLGFILFQNEIAAFFHLKSSTLIMIAGLIVLVSFVGTVNLAFLQGRLLFNFVTIINFIGTLVKLIVGIGLVLLGFRIFGAMWAFALGYIIPFILGFYQLRILFHKKTLKTPIQMKDLFAYGTPATIALFSLTSFISTDIMLVKHFFNPDDAGRYAMLSLIGRIIFFLSAPISSVMFPIVVHKYTKNERYTHIFILSLLLVSLPSIILSILYFVMPEFPLSLFAKNKQNLNLTMYLGIFGVFISLYSILYVLVNFFLSISKTKVAIPIAIGAVLQVILLWFYHDTFYQIIYISLAIVGLLLIVLLLYYVSISRATKEKKS